MKGTSVGSVLSLLLVLTALLAAQPSGEAILQKLDANNVPENRIVVAEMTIHARRATRTMQLKSWIAGSEKSFTEFLAPARDAGTKMLKLSDQLWTYTPATDRIIQIAGHMLRQSLMGSDLSYEDLMEDRRIEDMYVAEVMGGDTILERPCWIVDLTARDEDVAYASRRIWVDEERYLVLKEERYAKSGELLKTTEVNDCRKVEGRWVVTDAVFRDALRPGEGTQFVVDSIQFNADIPDYIFSKAALK
jgi:outer membrane lipoprotein-sorting protein